MSPREFHLGATRSLDGQGVSTAHSLPMQRLVNHGVIVGMSGSGKTGLITVLVEEALRARVPVLMLDVKGDLPNLLLAFPTFDPAAFVPWVDPEPDGRDGRTLEAEAIRLANERRAALTAEGLDERDLHALHDQVAIRVITPGSHAGEPLHVLSTLERPNRRWDTDEDEARASLSTAIALVLRLLGRDADPARSREHVVLSLFAERRLRAGEPAGLDALLHDVLEPPTEAVGAMPMDEFLPRHERRALAAALNALLASPTFASWRKGAPVDVASWMKPQDDGRTPATIVSVAHLDDAERLLVLGIVLEEVLAWVRTQSGTSSLRALVVMDEAYGFLPPYPSNPPTKRPIVSLMKQARAFGVGVVVATQNPMDLDYRALGNAGLWFVGRLQTDADRARVVDGMAGSEGGLGRGTEPKALRETVNRLAARWFVLRDVRAATPVLLRVRTAMSWLRGPLTAAEMRKAREAQAP